MGSADGTVTEVIASEGSKEVLNQALTVARSKPTMSIATVIICIVCKPAVGIGVSPSMCVA